jgi:hypothetical protein
VEVAAGEGERPPVALHNVHLKVGPGHHFGRLQNSASFHFIDPFSLFRFF